jgi:nitrate reductase molybdenum cofactor assembly chaperone NarJ/NarW
METQTGNIFALLAEAFCYPAPGHLAALEKGLETLPAGIQKQSLAAFVGKIRGLSLGEWEELYTRTLDLNPPAAPYVGFQTWGESYQRGAFLSKMNRELMETGIDTQGELPDHLIPVLRYLGQAPEPLPELVEVLDPAIQRITAGLRKADSDNPYLDLLEAAQSLCSGLKKEPA